MALLMQPMTPHIAEEIWAALGYSQSITAQDWPKVDESLLIDEHINIPIQINGKKKMELLILRDASKEEIEKVVLENKKIISFINGKTPSKIIVVPGRIVNVVT